MKNSLFFLAFIVFLSCNKKKVEVLQKQELKPLLSAVKNYTIKEKVDLVFLKQIETWKELKAVDNFLSRFKKVSPNEILGNALELKGLVQSLKDSIKPILFESASFNTRIDILQNETLRLADMTFIPAIKAEEVTTQTDKIMNAFSAINSKINSILLKERFEDEIDLDIAFIGLDSTKIDSVSRKSIKKVLNDRKTLNKNFLKEAQQ
ncbi:hypothetical protein [Polaribacter glomeratus]|uniref:Lipoprotein n=1 Tax=Polaribacter glomeratus TaxID=102 RepID=A0A2S7WH09_9FLAO|nr:hypothetical protein [Polaribacter glomeratus]PQJ76889.1 hypothetical protein BTO16_13550 [Polaribacter glomeratus]TXD67267.1 hypothetical protein ESX12_01365 [Polaribacter glomeratus]